MTPASVARFALARAAEDAVSIYLQELGPNVSWDDAWFGQAYQIDAQAKGACEGASWIDYRSVARAALDRSQRVGLERDPRDDESQWRTAGRLQYDGGLFCEDLAALDLRAYAAREPGGEASRWYVDDGSRAVEVLYYADTGRAGVAAGADAVWTDADDARDAVVRVCLTGEVVP
jgi:hypothetical protein